MNDCDIFVIQFMELWRNGGSFRIVSNVFYDVEYNIFFLFVKFNKKKFNIICIKSYYLHQSFHWRNIGLACLFN